MFEIHFDFSRRGAETLSIKTTALRLRDSARENDNFQSEYN